MRIFNNVSVTGAITHNALFSRQVRDLLFGNCEALPHCHQTAVFRSPRRMQAADFELLVNGLESFNR